MSAALPLGIVGAAQSWRTVDPEPPAQRDGYRSADHLLERYWLLCAVLGSVPQQPWPSRETPRVDTSLRPGDGIRERRLIEMADLALCLRRARISRDGWKVLQVLHRPRRRYCRRCRYVGHFQGRRCPHCGPDRLRGWTFEPLPTLTVLAEELSDMNGRRWSWQQVRQVRDVTYERIEASMRRMGIAVE